MWRFIVLAVAVAANPLIALYLASIGNWGAAALFAVLGVGGIVVAHNTMKDRP